MSLRSASPLSAVAAIVACLGLVALARTGRVHSDGVPLPEVERGNASAPSLEPAQPDAGPSESAAARALRLGRPMDVNQASVDDLQLLPGIGPALSSRIVASRQERGAFRSLGDLRRVRGIGERTLERLRPLLRAGEGRDAGVDPSAPIDAGVPLSASG